MINAYWFDRDMALSQLGDVLPFWYKPGRIFRFDYNFKPEAWQANIGRTLWVLYIGDDALFFRRKAQADAWKMIREIED